MHRVFSRSYSRLSRPLATADSKWLVQIDRPKRQGAPKTRLQMTGIQTGKSVKVKLPHPVSHLIGSHQRYLLMELAPPYDDEYTSNLVIGDPLRNQWYSFPKYGDHPPTDYYWWAAVGGSADSPKLLVQVMDGESLVFDFKSHGWRIGQELQLPFSWTLNPVTRGIQWCGDGFYASALEATLNDEGEIVSLRKGYRLIKYDLDKLEWDTSKTISYSPGSDLELLDSLMEVNKVPLSVLTFYRLWKESRYKLPESPICPADEEPELGRIWEEEKNSSSLGEKLEPPAFINTMHWMCAMNEEPVHMFRKDGMYIWCTKDVVLVYDERDKSFRELPEAFTGRITRRMYLEYGSHDDELRGFEDFARAEM